MHKQWNIISRDFPGLERNPGIKILVKMTRDPGTEPLLPTTLRPEAVDELLTHALPPVGLNTILINIIW